MANAKNMREEMFFDPSVDWAKLDPYHVLVLRAFAPSGVFTQTAKTGYLTRVGGKPELSRLVNALFGDDYHFVSNLGEWQEYRAVIATMMQLAYESGIRRADMRVKNRS